MLLGMADGALEEHRSDTTGLQGVSGINIWKNLFSLWLQELLDTQYNLGWCWRHLEPGRFAFKNHLRFSLFYFHCLDKPSELWQLVCTHLDENLVDNMQQTSLHLHPCRSSTELRTIKKTATKISELIICNMYSYFYIILVLAIQTPCS